MNYYPLKSSRFISRKNETASNFISKTGFYPIFIIKMMCVLLAERHVEMRKKIANPQPRIVS